jgi:hypothetical protein
MTEFEKEIALIEKMGLKTSPLRLEYEKKCTNCGVCRRCLKQSANKKPSKKERS